MGESRVDRRQRARMIHRFSKTLEQGVAELTLLDEIDPDREYLKHLGWSDDIQDEEDWMASWKMKGRFKQYLNANLKKWRTEWVDKGKPKEDRTESQAEEESAPGQEAPTAADAGTAAKESGQAATLHHPQETTTGSVQKVPEPKPSEPATDSKPTEGPDNIPGSFPHAPPPPPPTTLFDTSSVADYLKIGRIEKDHFDPAQRQTKNLKAGMPRPQDEDTVIDRGLAELAARMTISAPETQRSVPCISDQASFKGRHQEPKRPAEALLSTAGDRQRFLDWYRDNYHRSEAKRFGYM
ncbi:hypothetical protein CSHISOI_10533 [Colletotrichum shisoi]|uniref:Uncharacterized protein n=1 Tax=Colletotrichum shisoi TaxID=2078593 RepID=A0A5Q4BDB3_9PEZI|nr:hypothetical protein CSHISOI_10533 [Colletotrichum shisoi]